MGYEYDIMHRLLNETNQQGLETIYTYDVTGNLTSKTTPDQNIVTYDYDELGRITSILDPEKKLTEIHYDPVGNIDRVLKEGTQEYIYSYDRANNLETVMDPLKRETTYTYDANNNVETMLTPSKNLITYNYDPLNRLAGTIDLLNGSKGYNYDASGNIDAITDGNGYTTKYQYDKRNLLEWVEDAEGNKTSYTYYNDGKLKTMIDGRNKTSKYSYTDAGYLEKFENSLGETKEYQYTLSGQVDNIIKPDGNQIDYIYDELNRLDTILYPDETTVEYQYDDLNRKTAMADKNGVTEYDYNTLGKLTKTVDPANEEVEFEYDEKGRKSKVIYPDDKYVTYDYDKHDRLVTITDRENRITSYTYDEAGRKKTVKLPNGITTTYNYDLANRIEEIISTKEDGSVVEKIAYDYDGESNKALEEIWKENKHYKRVYTYYKNNTVKGMVETGDNSAEYTYHYDGAGNIDQKTVTEDGITKTYTYSYNDANRMVTESENGEVRRSYAYDLNGNRTQRIISDDGKPVADYYYYDYTDQLEEVVEHSGKVYTYGYDGEGNRLWRTYSQYPVVKPPVDDGERVEDPAEFPGWNKDKDSELDHDNGKGNDFKVEGGEKKGSNLTSRIEKLVNINLASSDPSYLKSLMFAKKDGSDKENGQGNNGGNKGQNSGNGNSSSSEVNNGKDKEPGNGNNNNAEKENGKGSDNGKNNGNGNGNGNDKEQGNGKDKDNGSSDKSKVKDKEKDNNGKDKNEKENGNGWAKGKDKDKAKGDRGNHLGWYKNGKADNSNGNDPHNPGGDKLVNPEIFQVTNYINDLSAENEEVLMTSDVDGNYRGVYTYDNNHDLIGVEDLGEIQGKPNDPLYYLKDALGSITSITNMNGEIIDSNRFAPYGEPLDPVAKNARLTNSPYGYTGESHDIEGDLVYLRARYYEPGTMRFLQQDTLLGDIQQPLTRNLYIYGNDNPLEFVDPSGHYYISMKVSLNGPAHFTLTKDTYFGSLFKSLNGMVTPYGGFMNSLLEQRLGIIGGNSANTDNGEEDIFKTWFIFSINSMTSKKYEKLIEGVEYSTEIGSYALDGMDIVKTDSILFDLIERAGLSTTSTDYFELYNIAECGYAFILSNIMYFSDKLFNGKTLYQMHSNISNAKDKNRLIKQYTLQYKKHLEDYNKNAPIGATHFTADDIYVLTYKFTDLLNEYDNMLNSAAQEFKKSVEIGIT